MTTNNGTDEQKWSSNFWGKRWSLISFFIIVCMGVAIYFLDKRGFYGEGMPLSDEQEQAPPDTSLTATPDSLQK